jgi:tRNA pseudouridine38-40 synthase
MTTKLTIEYDGGGFAGWARQPELRTVQGELERALTTVLGPEGQDGLPLKLRVAGRTDTGVHAWGQVASYRHEAVDPLRLNGLLDDDLAVLAAEPADEGFDARTDALSRTYCYRLLNRRTRSVFERDALHQCAAAVLGPHDFTAFTPSDTEHTRFVCDVMRCEWIERGDLLELWIEADMFLRHMNRALVGSMIDVAEGRRSVEQFRELLEGRPRAQAGRTVAAHGLALASVRY